MFDRLFRRPDVLARQRSGPLLEERLRFLARRADEGLSRGNLREIARHLPIIAEALRLSDRPGELISQAEIDRQALLRGVTTSAAKVNDWEQAQQRFRRHAMRWLHFLGRLQPVPTAPVRFGQEVTAFIEFLHREKGLRPSTTDSYRRALGQFLSRLCPHAGSPQQVTIAQLDEAIIGQVNDGHYSRVTVPDRSSALRAFFRYAEEQGWCHRGLAASIRAPRVFSQAPIPAGPSWEEVRQLLAQAEGDRPDEIRGRAVLLLLAVYGLRGGEVLGLRLDDFDWAHGLIAVTSPKSRRSRVYPLVNSAAVAILRYLKEVRPRATCREVFLGQIQPPRPLNRARPYKIVARRPRPLCPSLPRHGPHALRHACATHLLEQGLTLKEIGDHLGHQHPDTTRIYAKVDLKALRQVADFDLGGLS
jgi:site-specific recombinase XerD